MQNSTFMPKTSFYIEKLFNCFGELPWSDPNQYFNDINNLAWSDPNTSHLYRGYYFGIK
ncbi:hypothetical protein MNBD_GAMMA12-2847 [hydrothermal vent metagenome]|uniref:Uncharacterized protein n=1 Tax=hydrothermal vent metagenome TaxID=652676 RepID=A0A3B0YUN2_9ZZZZ